MEIILIVGINFTNVKDGIVEILYSIQSISPIFGHVTCVVINL